MAVRSPTVDELLERMRRERAVPRLVDVCLREDLDTAGDVTTRSLVEPGRRAVASMVVRERGVIAGLDLCREDPRLDLVRPDVADGARVDAGTRIAVVEGPLAHVLILERTILNLVGWLSGIATLTRRFVDAVAGTNAVICDTRKTTPGLRVFEKYAVARGGATLHRLGLADAMLVKDNHIAHLPLEALGARLADAASEARRLNPALRFVEVEVDTLEQLDRVLATPAGAVDLVLLDNMDDATRREAVRRRDARRPDVRLEASGGVTLDTVRAIAESGVDRISVGALTHAARRLDIGLDIGPDIGPDARPTRP
ncbi:MAG: carboxylating nicotinate-nucleotide diphosphorylase [Phycisphaerales bacterium]|nr:carboxylating nicotinate-nucleotide diphosphorylase [Phycisphaerales bacterium]